MVKPFPSKTHIANHQLHPETLMLNYGYDPELSEGSVKPDQRGLALAPSADECDFAHVRFGSIADSAWSC